MPEIPFRLPALGSFSAPDHSVDHYKGCHSTSFRTLRLKGYLRVNNSRLKGFYSLSGVSQLRNAILLRTKASSAVACSISSEFEFYGGCTCCWWFRPPCSLPGEPERYIRDSFSVAKDQDTNDDRLTKLWSEYLLKENPNACYSTT